MLLPATVVLYWIGFDYLMAHIRTCLYVFSPCPYTVGIDHLIGFKANHLSHP